MQLLHRIHQIPLASELIHHVHHVKNFTVRHLITLGFSLFDRPPARFDLKLEAGNLFRGLIGFNQVVLLIVDSNPFTVVDVFEFDVSLCTEERSSAVAIGDHRSMEGSHFAARPGQRDGVRLIHPGFRPGAHPVDRLDPVSEDHHRKVDRVDRQIEQ